MSDIRSDPCWAEFNRIYPLIDQYTIVSWERLWGLFKGVVTAIGDGIPGDIVECGAAKGGSAAMMGLAIKMMYAERFLWVLDTFAGIPAPTAEDGEAAKQYTGMFAATTEEVQSLFDALAIKNYALVPGRFQDTLPLIDTGPIAVLHLDGDWYESTKVCLEHLFDKVSPGGVIQIDDYGHWTGCQKAVDDFFYSRSLHPVLSFLDYTGVQMRKEMA